MHNSGTSILGGLLNATGIPMGNQLLMRKGIPEELRPQYDYFEDKEIVDLQDKMLISIHRHWSSYRGSFPINELNIDLERKFKEKLSKIILSRLKNNRIWVVKDPRIGVLLNQWIDVLDKLKVKIKILIVHRDPIENIVSFSTKGQVPMLWAEALWQRTYANALAMNEFISKENIFITNFSELVKNSEYETKKICKFLDWKVSHKLSKIISSYINPGLPNQDQNKINSYSLKPQTIALSNILENNLFNLERINEEKMISSEIKKATDFNAIGLGLNDRFIGEQNLLPKAKVAIITSELQGYNDCGGIGSAYYELALALRESGHSVTIILITNANISSVLNMNGVEIMPINSEGESRLSLSRKLSFAIKNIDVDVIHVQDWLGLGSRLEKAYESECKPIFIVGLHGPTAWTRSGNPWPKDLKGGLKVSESNLYEEGLIRALEEDAICNADILVSPSKYMAEWTINNILKSSKNDPVVQRNCPLSRRIIGINKIPDAGNNDKKIIIYFGRLEERKGILLFLEAIKLIDFKPKLIYFVGNDCYITDNVLASSIVKRCLNELEINYEFKHNFKRDDALNFIQEVNGVILIPSIIENSPCVVEELLDSGLQVITTDIGGTKEMIRKDCAVYLSNPNPKDLALKINAAFSLTESESFLLKSEIEAWKIKTSWQAFHERIPTTNTDIDLQATQNLNSIRIYYKLIINKTKSYMSKIKDFILRELVK